MRIATGLLSVLLFAVGTPLLADQEPSLGSPDFYPSPERPVGWRGDGSGRFPGATPPTVWNRRVAGITSKIVVQATKPNGEPDAKSHLLEYFAVKDWLVAGPFSAPDPEKDIDKDFLGGEAEVQPDAGDKAGNVQWKVHRAYEGSQSYRNHNERTSTHLYVDFVHALGKRVPPEDPDKFAHYANLDKQAAYAHTYLYAPRESDVYMDIVHRLPAVKIWLNGAPQSLERGNARRPASSKIRLKQGWNRLLVKAVCDKAQMPWRNRYSDPNGVLGQTIWRFAMYIRPPDAGPFSYETKNISWMLKLTGRNASQPIVVGDKLFVGSDASDLLCIDKQSGNIQWMHTGTYWDAMSDEERAAVKDAAEPLLKELDRCNAEIISLLNANVSPQGLDTERQAAIDQELDERKELAKSVHNALASGRKGKLYVNEVSAGNAAPTSDGKLVYWVVQGSGGYLTSAFDLEGSRVWSSFEFQEGRASEHGSHRSPLLCEGRLLVSTNEKLIAYEALTGKELWRTPGPGRSSVKGQPIALRVNGRRALQTTENMVSLDGEVLSEKGFATWGVYIPVVQDGFLFNSCRSRKGQEFQAIAVPGGVRAGRNQDWRLDHRTLYGPLVDNTLVYYVASPLYVDGLIYQIDMTGFLVAIDTRERKRVYLRWMDGYNFNDRQRYGYCASPTLAGKNIYLLDGAGYTTILQPGPDGTVLGNNVIQNISNLPGSAPCKQEVFYSGMYFDGKRMFVHGNEYLYCIKER